MECSKIELKIQKQKLMGFLATIIDRSSKKTLENKKKNNLHILKLEVPTYKSNK